MVEQALQRVTLCCVSSTNRVLSERALLKSAERLPVARTILFSDQPPAHSGLEFVAIPTLASVGDYGRFVLAELGRHVDTEFAMIVQYDGFVVEARAWDPPVPRL